MGTLINTVQLIGRPGMDPEIKTVGEGRKMARFSIATNEKHYNEKNELVSETQWHNIVAWSKTAELVEKVVRKGKMTPYLLALIRERMSNAVRNGSMTAAEMEQTQALTVSVWRASR